MSLDRAQVEALVYAAIDDLNGELGDLPGLEKTPSARLLGEDAPLDSLAIVSLQMILETRIAETFGTSLVLDSDFFETSDAQGRTLGDLVDHLMEAIEQSRAAS